MIVRSLGLACIVVAAAGIIFGLWWLVALGLVCALILVIVDICSST